MPDDQSTAPMDDAPMDEAAIRAFFGAPSDRAVRKELRHLDKHARAFIALSPFLVIASSGPEGADASPRGDAPGFVAVLDDTTLLVPDRLGNNRVDTWLNVVRNPAVGLLFLLPGVNETLRVNGRGRPVTDPALLTPLAAQGKVPKIGLLVEVDAVYLQCAKALVRSELWNPDKQIERKSFPSLGQILADQLSDGTDAVSLDRSLDEGTRTRLY
ncbi:MAG TPA: pyridoxamine 5'-phosphate oxidase family protein [Stellaceae bacterium]|nr:pyridoxamine 5'-phosphate oxidase family protein [Stellaceae bacterium]